MLIGSAQSNILSTSSTAEQVLQGNYTPATYAATTVIDHPDSIAASIQASVSPDSIKNLLLQLSTFQNRNTGSDTLSTTTGIGAARRWVYDYFTELSAVRESRLIPSYLQFDQNICSMPQHRNIFAVLPGRDLTTHEVILVEGHMDSRCANVCDIICLAEGAEDNASGTALVMELARVMSQYTFDKTIVFMVTIGEEQGLLGANAFSTYVQQRNIPLKAVFNNDVIGGIICGQTSSPPSCPGPDAVDSTQVRLFSFGSFNSSHKGLARYIKLQYQEVAASHASVPMAITLMSAEDRTGRGGDHIPFREKGFPAMRFTSANEHGNGSNGPAYEDRQHSSADILGVDTDNDAVLDSFFVDFNYLGRNAAINGTALAMLAMSPITPLDFSAFSDGPQRLVIGIADLNQYMRYRIGIRTLSHDWDTVYTVLGANIDTLVGLPPATDYIVSVAAMDSLGVESLFTGEKMIGNTLTAIEENIADRYGIRLLQNRPNPFDEATHFAVWIDQVPAYQKAYFQISDLAGKEIARIPIQLQAGMNETLYRHGYQASGIYAYSLYIDGELIDSRRMVFAY